MKRVLIILCLFILISCRDKVICPAFQSTYILNDSTREAYFSYVWQLDEDTRIQFLATQQAVDSSILDSSSIVPQPKTDYYAYVDEINVPWRVPERTKYGIVRPVFHPIKNERLKTAPMINFFGPEEVADEFVVQELGDSLAADNSILAKDSLVANGSVAETKQQEEDGFLYGYRPDDIFNVEQFYYNKYFGDQLIDTRPPTEQLPEGVPTDSLSTVSDSTQIKEPFLKGLFKKKKPSKVETLPDTLEMNPPEEQSTPEPKDEDEGTEGDG